MARPEDHYLALFKRGDDNPLLATIAGEGLCIVEDPEGPPDGMCLPAAVELATSIRGQLDAKGESMAVIVMQRQSTGTYFPIAHVDSDSVMLLFDPGKPRLTVTWEGKKRLQRLGIRLPG